MNANRPGRILRFLAVGVLNTGFSYGIYALGIALSFHYSLANLIALILGMLFSFKTQGSLVFDNPDPGRIYRFITCWAVLYGLHTGLIGLLIGVGANALGAGALALVPIAALSYLVQKRFVFAPSPDTRCSPAAQEPLLLREPRECPRN